MIYQFYNHGKADIPFKFSEFYRFFLCHCYKLKFSLSVNFAIVRITPVFYNLDGDKGFERW